jgi:dihydrofolate reductase
VLVPRLGEVAGVLYSTMFISLDGVVSDPHPWHPRFMSEQSVAMLAEQLDSAEAMLLGRRTFDDFASYWPGQDDAVPLARRTNELPKFVLTRGPRLAEWAGSSIVGADSLAAATQMKRNYERIMVAGGAMLVRSLLAAGVLDEMRFYLDPIVLGRGQRLFDGGLGEVSFQLADRRDLPNGVQYLAYRPGTPPARG